MTKEVSFLAIFGDSLSDSGNMEHSHLAGFIPTPGTGLDKSGSGRFADRLSWPGYLMIWRMQQAFPESNAEEISEKLADFFVDEVIENGSDIRAMGNQLARNYAVGGATSKTYHVLETIAQKIEATLKAPLRFLNSLDHLDRIPCTISAVGAQVAVTNLQEERERFIEEHKHDSQEAKEKTLIIEWSGANDLITVHTEPSYEIADRAVKARLLHLEELYKEGYRNFVLFNLPDLSLAPRYQKESKETQVRPASPATF